MEAVKRKPLQGIKNIIRFNWHLYVMAIIAIAVLLFSQKYLSGPFDLIAFVFAFLIFFTTAVSLIVSLYVYDLSDFYSLDWLEDLHIKHFAHFVNIHAGFDEISELLAAKFPDARIEVFDFYDPKKHTEVSIKRARKAYPAYHGTKKVDTSRLPLQNNSVDAVFCILSAHEIRNRKERIAFFAQLKQALKEDGKIVVAEHLRDISNFAAYTIGFFHFFSGKSWKHIFRSSGLLIRNQFTITPFITCFILQKNGTAS